jgi:hypothetical protein
LHKDFARQRAQPQRVQALHIIHTLLLTGWIDFTGYYETR